MKSLSIQAIITAFYLIALRSQSQTVSLTIVTNPPQGGTVTGAGAYSVGTSVTPQIQASNGWYINNILIGGGVAPHFDQVRRVSILLGADPTTITSDSETFTLNSDTVVSVIFNVISPVFPESPIDQIAVRGGTASLGIPVNGRIPIFYQWQRQGTNLPGATNSALTFNNVQQTNAGSYTLVASNAFGVATSAPVSLIVKDFVISTNGVPVNAASVGILDSTTISFQSSYQGGVILYTLDGSEPDFNATPYSGPFGIFQSCTIRAIAYSSDFSQSTLSDPLVVNVFPTHSIYAFSPGGGTIMLGTNAPYTNGAPVTATALPDPGWTFMGWSDALSGANPTNTFSVNGDMVIRADFGTTLTTTHGGSGTVSVHPSAPLYPYGSSVLLSAVPNPGNYFALWGNATTGSQNPLFFSIYSPTQTVSALFASVPSGQASITVLSQGGGTASASPQTNKVAIGSTITLTATPSDGQQFLGWSGDASGTQNPLNLLMDTNKTVTAQFSRVPRIALAYPGLPITLEILGAEGDVWTIEGSSDLSTWTPLFTVTNFYSSSSAFFSDPASTNFPHRMYRAVSQ